MSITGPNIARLEVTLSGLQLCKQLRPMSVALLTTLECLHVRDSANGHDLIDYDQHLT